MDLDNFCLIQRKICSIGGLYKPIEKSHKSIISFNPFIQISHIFFTPEYSPSIKMATFLSFNKNALAKLLVVLLAILLIQQHVVQVDGQMCDPSCPEGKYCSWFWCYDCHKNGAECQSDETCCNKRCTDGRCCIPSSDGDTPCHDGSDCCSGSCGVHDQTLWINRCA